jgi:NAD(P)-dependent dehydrogenase (short-subunit alcohol dehydrogenase family)
MSAQVTSQSGTTLTGTTILVTGATSGLGLETARELAGRGAHVVIGARSREQGDRTVDLIRADHSAAALSPAIADLSTRDGVRSLAAQVLETHARLDVLVNNAGGVRAHRHETADGLEWTFAVNHLAAFLLTRLLLGALGERGRMVIVTSDAHRDATLDFDDLQATRAYDPTVAYQRSKLANVLFAHALARRMPHLSIVAVAPGIAGTDIVREGSAELRRAWAARGRSARDAARFIVDAVCAPPVGQMLQYVSEGRLMAPSADAQDDDLSERLWDVSAALTQTPSSPPALVDARLYGGPGL